MNRNLLIKPASGACNMHCDYCFYADEQDNRSIRSYGMMSNETAHNMIDLALENPQDSCVFAFQGGEPTLAGLDFFSDFVSYAKSKGENRVSFALQTNGFVIDHEWARFFHDNKFLIGLSMDGNKKIHDRYRHSKDGSGSFKNTFRASQILTSEKVDFNILITVTRDVAENIKEIHPFFIRNNFRYLQYIPCIDPIDANRGNESYSLNVDLYGKFLCDLFDMYYRDWERGEYVSIRFFDNLVLMLLGQRPEACGMAGICGMNYVVEADGGVFPCDFYVLDGYKLGNINDGSFDSFEQKRNEIGFIQRSRDIAPECKECRFFALCRGGCRRDRDDFLTGPLPLNYLCSAFKTFYSYSIERLEKMAAAEAQARSRM